MQGVRLSKLAKRGMASINWVALMVLNEKNILGTIILTTGLLLSGHASATVITFDTSHPTYNYGYSYTIDGASISATIGYTLNSIDSSSAKFTVNVKNTSASSPGTNRIVSFGIDTIDPAVNGVSTTSTTWSTTLDTTFAGYQQVAFCAWAGKNCTGGSNSGLLPGDSASFDVTFDFTNPQATTSPSITFGSPFPSKWQAVGINGNSWEIDANCFNGSCGPDVPPQLVPEPDTVALFGLGLAGIGFIRRRAAKI